MRRITGFAILAIFTGCLAACGEDVSLAEIDAEASTTEATGALSAPSLAYATQDGFVIRGVRITRDNLATWAPVVRFHPQERYLPCDIEHLLQGATLANDAGQPLRRNPSQADLAGDAPATTHRVILNAATYGGTPLGRDAQVQAPMYVSAQVPEGGAYVDLNYIFLMGFNGSQAARLKLFGVSTELVLPQFAHHEGDIESISVRTTPDFKKVLWVRFEAHGHSHFVSPDEAHFEEGTHVAVLSALNSHASYNAKRFPTHHQHLDAAISIAGFGLDVLDITDASGPSWRPYGVDEHGQSHDVGSLRFVGIDAHGAPLGDERWAAFAGRIGDTWENKFMGVQRPDGSLPNLAVRSCANGLIHAAVGLGKTKPFTQGAGTLGLADRASVQVTQPCWHAPAQ